MSTGSLRAGCPKVFVQQRDGAEDARTAWPSLSANTAAEGFGLLGYDVEPFHARSLTTLGLSPESPVVGFLAPVEEALRMLGVAIPDLHPAPPELASLYGRKVWESTLGAIRKEERSLFIKPRHAHKAFTGHVRSADSATLATTAAQPDDLPILVSEVVTIESEWRCFVVDGSIVDARPYTPIFGKAAPDWNIATTALKLLKVVPRGFSLDVAVLDSGHTVVVEINDGYALAPYGLRPLLYAQLLLARWQELCSAK